MNNEAKKLNFHIVPAKATEYPKPIEEKISGKEYVFFGKDNLYPLFMSGLYENSATLAACINSLTDYVFAHGITDEDKGQQQVNKNKETFDEILKLAVNDYIAYGAFALQMIGNDYGEVVELYYIDVRKVRLSEDGKKVYFNKDNWLKSNRKTITCERFRGNEKTKNCIFYYKRPQSKSFYGLPLWFPALKHVMTDTEIANFHHSAITNNFAPSVIISFNNGVPSEEIQDQIEEKLTRKFVGTDNAARFIVTYNDDKEHATDIARLSEDNFDQKYDALSKTTRDNILAAFRVSSALVGIMPQQTGFNSVEYESAFKLYKETVVKPLQQEIESALKRVGIEIQFTEFEVKFDESQPETDEVNG